MARCSICEKPVVVNKRAKTFGRRLCRDCYEIFDFNYRSLVPPEEHTPPTSKEYFDNYRKEHREHINQLKYNWLKKQKLLKLERENNSLITVSLLNKGIGR